MKSIIVAFLSIALVAAPLHAGNCGLLYRQQVVQQVYAAPVIAAPVYYSVGQNIQEDALAERIAAKVALKFQALQAAPIQAQHAKATLLSAKCARCHSGDNAKGGVVLDGSVPVDDGTFRAVVRMLGTGKGVPKAMAGVVAGLSPAEKGGLTEELLGLEAVTDVPPEPGELK